MLMLAVVLIIQPRFAALICVNKNDLNKNKGRIENKRIKIKKMKKIQKTTIFLFVGVLLICGVVMVYNVLAATPNPGHPKSEIDIGDKSCTWVAANAAQDYTCGTGKYIRGLRLVAYGGIAGHTHTGYYYWNGPGCSLGCTTSSANTGSPTIYVVSHLECCTF